MPPATADDDETRGPSDDAGGPELAPQRPTGGGRWRALALIGFALAVVALFATGSASLDPNELRLMLRDAGIWGGLLFVLANAALQPLGVAGHVFAIGAGLIWPAPIALALAWTGAIAASCSSFFFARFVGQRWVQARLPGWLREYDERLETRGFRTVLVMRLLFYTFGPMQMMFGVSRVRFGAFISATALGLLPLLCAEVLLGAEVLTRLLQWLWA